MDRIGFELETAGKPLQAGIEVAKRLDHVSSLTNSWLTVTIYFRSYTRCILALQIVLWIVASSVVQAGGPIRIQCIGDSTTAGYTDNPAWKVEFDFGYRLSLYQQLTAANYFIQFVGDSPEPWSGEYGVPKTIGLPDLRDLDQDHHRGYAWLNADRTRSNIVEWLQSDNPDVILLMIGRIDLSYGEVKDVTKVENSLSNLVETIVTARPQVYLVVAQITPYIAYDENLVKYNQYIASVLVPYYASQGKRVTSVDQYANFILPGGDLKAIDRSVFADSWQHADPAGNEKMAQTWFKAVSALFPATTIVDPPRLLPNGHFRILFSGRANSVYQIDRSSSLVGPWQIGFTNIMTDAGGLFELDDASPPSAPAGFYRISAH